jgi:hypothetical protein
MTNHVTSFTGLTGEPSPIPVAWAQGTIPGAVLDFAVFKGNGTVVPAFINSVQIGGVAGVWHKPALGYAFFVEERALNEGHAIPIEYAGVAIAPDLPGSFGVDIVFQPGYGMDLDLYWHSP